MYQIEGSPSPEYVITTTDGQQETIVPGTNAPTTQDNIARAGQLLHQIRMKEKFDRLMARAGRNKHTLNVKTAKNRKRGKLAKASRKANRG